MSYEVVTPAECKNQSSGIKSYSNSIEKNAVTEDKKAIEMLNLHVGDRKAVYSIDVNLVAMTADGKEAASYRIHSCVRNPGGKKLYKVGSDSKSIVEDVDEWDAGLILDGAYIRLMIKGDDNKKIYWKTYLSYVNHTL